MSETEWEEDVGAEDADADDGEWEFLSTDGCPLCAAMEGAYAEEPTRPHEHCECEVVFVRYTTDRYGNGWWLDYEQGEWGYDDSETVPTFRAEFTLYLECCDGQVFDEPFEHEGRTPQSVEELDDFFDEAAREADEYAAGLAELNCPDNCVGFPCC